MIKRYDCTECWGMELSDDGLFVNYTDHLAEVKRGQEVVSSWIEISDKQKNELTIANAKLADKESELSALRLKLESAEKDAERIDWIEKSHGLHTSIEILYVVDGYDVQHMYDGSPIGRTYFGESLRLAIDAALQQEKEWGK